MPGPSRNSVGSDPLTTKCVAGPLETVVVLVLEKVLAAGSVAAVNVSAPGVSNMTLKVPTPLAKVASAGSTALASLLEKWTEPANVTAVWLVASWAVTVTSCGTPAVAVASNVTAKCVAGAGATVIVPLDPMTLLATVSVTINAAVPAVFSVALKVPTPPDNVVSAGNTAAASLLVK